MERRQEKFCYGYVQSGNASEAYRIAGYKATNEAAAAACASRLLRNDKVRKRIEELRKVFSSDAIACALERREFLTAVIRSNDAKTADRLKAVDLMNRMDGLYISKLAGPEGGAITISWKSGTEVQQDDDEDATDEDDDE